MQRNGALPFWGKIDEHVDPLSNTTSRHLIALGQQQLPGLQGDSI